MTDPALRPAGPAGSLEPPAPDQPEAAESIEGGAVELAVADPASALAGHDTSPDDPVLVVPEDLVIDDAAADRLRRQLDDAGPEITAVVATVVELPAGSSTRTQAERMAMSPLDAVRPGQRLEFVGAALVRPGVGYQVGPTGVSLEAGPVLVDPGAPAHDPWRLESTVEAVSPEGRPPFRWRPVVILLGLEPDLELAETARSLANGLIQRNVEARLAVPRVPEGKYLTAPCTPERETLQTLQPDVVIALDPEAARVAPDWCGDNRSTVLIELSQDIAHDVTLIPWRIGIAQGRWRARIGRGIGAGTLAPLVNRLCSGPHPLPPARDGAAVTSSGTAVNLPSVRTMPPPLRPFLIDPTDASPHLRGIVAELAVAGITVEERGLAEGVGPTAPVQTADGSRTAIPAGLISSAIGPDAFEDRARQLRRMGALVLIDIEPSDVRPVSGDAAQALILDPAVELMADVADAALAPSRSIADHLRARSVPTHVVDLLPSRLDIQSLNRAADQWEWPEVPTIGWTLDGPVPLDPDIARAVAAALGALLDGPVPVRLEVIVGQQPVPGDLAARDHVAVRTERPPLDDLAAWTGQLWTPPGTWAAASGDTAPIVLASLAGVPTVVGSDTRAAMGGLVDPGLVVDELDQSEAWARALGALVDRRSRQRRSRRARQVAMALHGPAAATMRINRLAGWLALAGIDGAAG